MIYLGLFASAFAAATLLPAQSEAVLVGLLTSGYDPFALVAWASAGNILGSCINWWLGLHAQRFSRHRWFPVSAEGMERAKSWYRRYGRWTLLLSWAPIIGDPMTLAAGVMRERFAVFLALVSIAKTGRYIALALVTLEMF